jgi:aspartate aminotransferase
LKSRSLVVNGVSKSHAMTGWRVGYAAGPELLMEAMSTIQSQSCTSVCSIAQAAAAAALTGPQDHVLNFRNAFQRRRDLVVTAVSSIDGLSVAPPKGAFYAYIYCKGLVGRRARGGAMLSDDQAVAEYLLRKGRVAVVPGAAYGLSPYFRISTATSDGLLSEAMARIAAAVAGLEAGQEAA